MSVFYETVIEDIKTTLQKEYRGVNIAVYAIATAGLTAAIHKIRPVSKFSKVSQIPRHFIERSQPLNGSFAGVQHSPIRVLVHHQAPIYLPLWHSIKPPLPVKLWGVEISSGNAINWLQCVAAGQKLTFKPIATKDNELYSTVVLHLQKDMKEFEKVDIGKRLVELGFAKASVPKNISKDSLEYKLAPEIISAESRAKSVRNGIWADLLPPLPFYIVYWRKSTKLAEELVIQSTEYMLQGMILMIQLPFRGVKKLVLMPFTRKTTTT